MEKSKHPTQDIAPAKAIVLIYVICAAFRAAEYFILRTDQGVLGEAFAHKLVGILVLALAARHFAFQRQDIGFTGRSAGTYALCGLLLGVCVYAVAYGVELALLFWNGDISSLQVYVTRYTMDGNQGRQTEVLYFLFCIVGNVINVIMEEGMFRGLFIKLSERKYSFYRSIAFSSALFGLWHIAAPLRALLDGERSTSATAALALILVFTSGIAGIKFCLLAKISGSLWMPMADHFFNNTVVNLLHVTSASGTDQLLTARISVAQTLSFLIVLFLYIKTGAHNKHTFRASFSGASRLHASKPLKM